MTTCHRLLARARSALVTEPDPRELAARMGVPVGKIELLLDAAKHPVSLEMPAGKEEDMPIGSLVRDRAAGSPEEDAIRSQLAQEVEHAMQPLEDRATSLESRVRLRGTARSRAERDEAERLTWPVPGVVAVDNEMEVS